ncbi:MAG: hypothetical protein C0408_02520 [Odoribacter sp.]|nr:hypothetical protein [Odoribacter sp.]
MKEVFQYSLYLLFYSLLIITAGLIINSLFEIVIPLPDIVWLTGSFYLTVLISIFIFLKGQKKETGRQALYSLVSITLKFLLELIIALIWFLIAKKTSNSSVLLFFVLYLAFTLFSIFVILNTLKNKSL